MTAARRRQRPASVRCRSLSVAAVVALGVVLGTGCASEDSPARDPEQRVQPSTASSSPSDRDCAGRVDALIDSRTIPRSDREYATDMCLQHR